MSVFSRLINWGKEVASGKNKVLAVSGPVGLAYYIASQRSDQKATNQINNIPGWVDLPTAADIAAYENTFNKEGDNRLVFVNAQLKRLNDLAEQYKQKIVAFASQKGIKMSQAATILGAGAGAAATLVSGPFIPVTAVLSFAFSSLGKQASANEQRVFEGLQTYIGQRLNELNELYVSYQNEQKQLQNPLTSQPIWVYLVALVLVVYLLKRKNKRAAE